DPAEIGHPVVGQPVGTDLLRATGSERPDVPHRTSQCRCQRGARDVDIVADDDNLVRRGKTGDHSSGGTRVGDDLVVPVEQPARQRASATAPAPTITSFGTGHNTVITRSAATNVSVTPRPNS